MTRHSSPGSLIITFYGAYGREFPDDGTVPVSALIRLLGALDVDAPSVRSAVSRLKRRGLLVAERAGSRAAGYRPSTAARQLLEDGDRRIYRRPYGPDAPHGTHSTHSPRDPHSPQDPHAPQPDGEWLLAVFSVPESERRRRHVLRSQLARLGFGNAAPGVWIAPARLEEETRHTLRRLGLAPYVEMFRGTHTGFVPTAEAVARWWDLEALALLHQEFLDEQEPVLHSWSQRTRPALEQEEAACRDYLFALDAWRRLPYADPGLPGTLLPDDWPGRRSAQVFAELHDRLWQAGGAFTARLRAAAM